MNTKILPIREKCHPHLLVLITLPELRQEIDSLSNLFFFLLHYSFFLTDTPAENLFLKRQIPPPGELFFQNPNGARYLDPKYSRWISTDPALGEYMSGSDAGCGGAYNPVNMSLYHYAGNNPVKYVDPTGLHIDDWQDNGDGTWTVKSEGATLWDIYGAYWQEKSGYEGDPTKLRIGDTVGKKSVPVSGVIPSSVKQDISKGNAQKINNNILVPNDSKNIVFSGGFGVKAALVLGLGGETGLIVDINKNEKSLTLYWYLAGSIGCGIETPAVKKTDLTPMEYLKKSMGPTGTIELDSNQTKTGSTLTADICLGVIGTYDLNNLNSSGLPNSWGVGSVGGGVWKTGILAVPVYKFMKE